MVYKPNARARTSFLCLLLPPLLFFLLLVLLDVAVVPVRADASWRAVAIATEEGFGWAELAAAVAPLLPHALLAVFVFGFPPTFDAAAAAEVVGVYEELIDVCGGVGV